MATHQQALAALRALEPLFHRVESGTSREAFERMTAAEFWEVGASGSVYTRAMVLDVYQARFADPAYDPMAGLAVDDFAVRQLGPSLWLATYRLAQGERLTRRATLWRETTSGWQAEYHQGTVIGAEAG